MKNSNDTIGNQTVVQCLNQLRHHAPQTKVYKIWYVLCVKFRLYVNTDTHGYKVIPDIFTEYRICTDVLGASQK